MLALESLTGYDIDTLSRYVNKGNKEHRRWIILMIFWNIFLL
jgi:hypothetical protein